MDSSAIREGKLPPAILLMGPTAAGKTGLALAIHDRMPVGLISVDSTQVYRGLDVGSAKLDPETLARYPHELIDIREPEQPYSAAEFVADAEIAMRAAAAAGKLPLLVGGTNLYFRALLYGLDDLPAAEPELRAQMARQAEQRGWAFLHRELERRDPETARRIRPTDPQRIQRALEVLELTGEGLSVHHRQPRLPRFPSLRIVLTAASRSRLHARIEKRAAMMLQAGLVEEVIALRRRPGLHVDTPAMRSVGYRQVWAGLERGLDPGDLLELIAAATRQLAKRQLTGFRKFSRTLWYDSEHPASVGMVARQAAGFAARVSGRAFEWGQWQAKYSKTPPSEQ